MIGGFMTTGTPEKLVDALVDSGVEDLTIVCNDGGLPGRGAAKLVKAGIVTSYITSHIGLNPMLGKLMNEGKVDVQLIPQGTLAERIRCGGAGLGGVLTPTGVGTLVEKGKQVITIDGKKYLLEKHLMGDVGLIAAHRADRMANLNFRKSARNFNPVMATACKYVIAEVAHIEDVGSIDPDHINLPGVHVNAIVQKRDL